MQRISVWLWLALAGAVLQFVSLGSNFYVVHKKGDRTADAWFGVPHTSDLILVSALVTIVGLLLAARDRSPIGGRAVGLWVGGIGLLALAQTVYRIVVPPFGCLTYGACGTTAKADVTILAGMWIAVAGSGLATLGGAGHALSAAARRLRPTPFVAVQQTGITPWLGLSALGLVVAFAGPFPFKAYRVEGFYGSTAEWSGWLSMPHTSSLVLVCTLIGVGLVVAAARRRAPLTPAGMGAALGVLALIVGARELFRVFQAPFSTAGGANDVHVGSVTILTPYWIGVAGASVALLAAIAQAVLYYRESTSEAARAPQAPPRVQTGMAS